MSEPARRRRLSPEQRRDQLVRAAVEVLAERGYRGTSAEAIVAAAGVSKGLLWRYFDDLDDLLAHTARASLATLAREVGAAVDLDAPAPEVLRAAIRVAAGLSRTRSAERAALEQIVPNLRRPDGSPRLTLDDYDELWTAQEAIFRRGQDDGDVRADLDPRVLAVTYQGAVDAMLGYLDRRPDVDAEQYAATVADVLLDGVRA